MISISLLMFICYVALLNQDACAIANHLTSRAVTQISLLERGASPIILNATNNFLSFHDRYLKDSIAGELNLKIIFEDENIPRVECSDLKPLYHLCSIDPNVEIDIISAQGKQTKKGHSCSTFASDTDSGNLDCLVTFLPNGVLGQKNMDKQSKVSFAVSACMDEHEVSCAELEGYTAESRSSEEDIEDLTCLLLPRGEIVVSNEDLGRKLNQETTKEQFVMKMGRTRLLKEIEKWSDCYPGAGNEEEILEFSIGIAIGSELFKSKFINHDELQAVKWLEALVSESNVVFTRQLNLKLVVKHVIIVSSLGSSSKLLEWDNPGCHDSIFDQLTNFLYSNKPSEQGLWHHLDDCYIQGDPVGIAYRGTLCSKSWNVGSTNVFSFSQTWLTFTHEIAHNFGAHHSFEDGKGTTGGIMDYGKKLYDNEYQFNKKYRFHDLCDGIQSSLVECPQFWKSSSSTTVSVCGDGQLGSGEQCECPIGQTDCSCCHECKLKEKAQCDPIHNECCSDSCSFRDTSATCSHSEGRGYCRNGYCALPLCKYYGIGDFCGVHTNNPCKVKCELDSVCYSMEGWTSGGLPINLVRDGAFCSQSGIAFGKCIGGACIESSNTESPSFTIDDIDMPDSLTPTSASGESVFPSMSPTQGPSTSPVPHPTFSPMMLPTKSPSEREDEEDAENENKASSCCEEINSDLNDNEINFVYKSPYAAYSNVCGESVCLKATWQEAKEKCRDFGARLCTYNEVVARAVKDTGCKVNRHHVWTATSCDEGYVSVNGKYGDGLKCEESDLELLVVCCAEGC